MQTLVDVGLLNDADLLHLYNRAALKLRRPGVAEFVLRESAVARTRRILAEARMTVVSSHNQVGWAVLPYAVQMLTGEDVLLFKRFDYPCRPGTLAASWWRKLDSGMSIRTYIAVRKPDPQWKVRQNLNCWVRREWLYERHYKLAKASS